MTGNFFKQEPWTIILKKYVPLLYPLLSIKYIEKFDDEFIDTLNKRKKYIGTVFPELLQQYMHQSLGTCHVLIFCELKMVFNGNFLFGTTGCGCGNGTAPLQLNRGSRSSSAPCMYNCGDQTKPSLHLNRV